MRVNTLITFRWTAVSRYQNTYILTLCRISNSQLIQHVYYLRKCAVESKRGSKTFVKSKSGKESVLVIIPDDGRTHDLDFDYEVRRKREISWATTLQLNPTHHQFPPFCIRCLWLLQSEKCLWQVEEKVKKILCYGKTFVKVFWNHITCPRDRVNFWCSECFGTLIFLKIGMYKTFILPWSF